MSIKQNGGVFGRNPTFNDVTIEGDLIINGEVFTGLDFQGSWNASTNSPALASSVGTNGEFYIVSVAGATDLNGITNWGIGDWAIFNGTAWQRVEGGADGNFNDLTANSLTVTGFVNTDGIVHTGDTDTYLKFLDNRIYSAIGNIRVLDFETSSSKLISADSIFLQTGTTALNRLKVSQNGDVSLYETTGTTPKMVWDASEETLFVDQKIKVGNTTDGVVLQTSTGVGSILGVDTGGNGWNDLDIRCQSGPQLYLDTSGSVGIGTDSPTASLSLSNATNDSNGIKMQASGWGYYARSGINGTTGAQFIRSTNWNANSNSVDSSGHATTAIIQDTSSGNIKFSTGTTNTVPVEAMRIDASQNVLIAGITTDPQLTTNPGVVISEDAYVGIGRANNVCLFLNRQGSDGEAAVFRRDGGTKGSISVTGSATAYNTSSDYRLKEDVQPMSGATDRLKELNPVNFAWKVDGSRVDGFIAHEAQEVVPESVTGSKDAMQDEEYEVTAAVYEDVITPAVEAVLDEDGAVITEAVEETTESVLVSEAVMGTRSVPDMQGIDQSKLVPLLTAALQEAITKIEELTTRIETLEGQ